MALRGCMLVLGALVLALLPFLLAGVLGGQRRGGPARALLFTALGGAAFGGLWFLAVMVLVLITRAGNAGLWVVFTPLAFLLGAWTGLCAWVLRTPRKP